jgi:hypothetical protein
MTISTQPYTAVAGQARQATEKSVETFKNMSQQLTTQLEELRLPSIPSIDLTQPVGWYFDSLQKVVDFNRGVVTQWAQLLTPAAQREGDGGSGEGPTEDQADQNHEPAWQSDESNEAQGE